jgi:hypothetical protein
MRCQVNCLGCHLRTDSCVVAEVDAETAQCSLDSLGLEAKIASLELELSCPLAPVTDHSCLRRSGNRLAFAGSALRPTSVGVSCHVPVREINGQAFALRLLDSRSRGSIPSFLPFFLTHPRTHSPRLARSRITHVREHLLHSLIRLLPMTRHVGASGLSEVFAERGGDLRGKS